jgi:hypothetical protein
MAKDILAKKEINTSHAWKGTWNRPMKIDEDSLNPFTVARMTDHNVRGSDDDDEVVSGSSPDEKPPKQTPPLEGDEPI